MAQKDGADDDDHGQDFDDQGCILDPYQDAMPDIAAGDQLV
jgi:hypothetical protein